MGGLKYLSLAAAFVLIGCMHQAEAPTPAPSRAGDIAAGRHLAQTNCASCHAIGAVGESRNPAAPPFRVLSYGYPLNSLEEAFAEGILVGHPDMPEFELAPQQINDLLAYIESVQQRRSG